MEASRSTVLARYGSCVEQFASAHDACAAILARLPGLPDEVWSEDTCQKQIAEYHVAIDGHHCHLQAVPLAQPGPHRYFYEDP